MASSPNNIETRAELFAERHGGKISGGLGAGFDGSVFVTSRHSAAKVFRFEPLYQREPDVYLRLRQKNITNVMGFQVPQLMDIDDDVWVVEMTIVKHTTANEISRSQYGMTEVANRKSRGVGQRLDVRHDTVAVRFRNRSRVRLRRGHDG